MRKFSHQILSIYVDVCIVLLCLCIGMYRVGDEMKWNDGILVICERTEKFSSSSNKKRRIQFLVNVFLV